MRTLLQTGQITCHDARGRRIDCTGSGQDADFKCGVPWPAPRFEVLDDAVLDRLTMLVWTRNANRAEFPLAWQEALDYIATMNRDQVFGSSDWRLPNRRELRSLMSHQTGNRLCRRGIPLSTYSADGTGRPRLRRSTRPMPGISIWKAHECFTAGRSSLSCYGPFEERGTPFSLLPAKPGVMTPRDNSSPVQDPDRTENSDQGCDGLNPVLRKQAVWSSTGSRTSAGAPRPTSPEDPRPGRKRSSSDRPQPTAGRGLFLAAAEHQ